MSEWEEFKIKDIVEGFYDGPHATPKEADKGAVFLSIHNLKPSGGIDLSDTKYISMEDFPVWTRRVKPRHKDIVFSYEATLHRYAIIPENLLCCLGRRLALLRINENKADYRFVYYVLISAYWRRKIESRIITGATVDRIPLIDFPNFKIPLPPLPIQRRIADILGHYDTLIDNYQRQITTLEQLAQEIYREWFVRGRCPYAQPGENGELPEGWEAKTLSDIAYINRYSLTDKQHNLIINYVDISSVGTGQINEHTEYRFEDAPGRARRLAKNGDIIFSTVRPENRCYALVLNQIQNLVFSTGFAVLTPKDPLFAFLIYGLVSSDFFITEVSNKAKGAAYPQVGTEDLMAIKIILPNREILAKFDHLAGSMYRKIANLQTQLTNLRQTRDALLPRLLSGQLAFN